VVTVTEGFRHDSIPAAERFVSELAPRMGFKVTFARNEVELPVALASLADVKVVMFVNTTGELRMQIQEMSKIDRDVVSAARSNEIPSDTMAQSK